MVQEARGRLGEAFPLASGSTLHIHHYVSTTQARQALGGRLAEAGAKLEARSYGSAVVTEGMLLPPDLRLGRLGEAGEGLIPTGKADAPVVDLCR